MSELGARPASLLLTALLCVSCLAETGRSKGSATGDGGQAECLVLTPGVLNFANTVVGSTAILSTQLMNQCVGSVTAIQTGFSGADAKHFALGDLPTFLGPAASVSIDVSYSPTALESRAFAEVTFTSPDSRPALLSLFGEPIASAITVAPGAIDFGYVSPPGTITSCLALNNDAQIPIDVSGIAAFVNPGGAFQLAQSSDSFPLTLPPGGGSQLCLSFAPPAAQQYRGQLTLLTTSAGSNLVVGLSGWGGGPRLSCAPIGLDFGPQLIGTSLTLPIECRNAGTAGPGTNLTIDAPNISPMVFTAGFDRSVKPYPRGGLAPGQTAQLDVIYAPNRATDDRGSVLIQSNGGELQIPLSGKGVEPGCQAEVTPPGLDFGNLLAGTTSETAAFEVDNTGSQTCILQGLAVQDDSAGSFSIESTSIEADPLTRKIAIPPPGPGVSASLLVQVRFQPAGHGAFAAKIPMLDTEVVLSGTNEATCLQVSPAVLKFEGQGAAGNCQLSPKSFSIVNTCAEGATVQSASLQTGPGDPSPQFEVTGPTLPLVLAPGEGQAWSIAPIEFSGTHGAELLVSDGAVEGAIQLLSTCQ